MTNTVRDLFADALIRANAHAAATLAGLHDSPLILAQLIHAARLSTEDDVEYVRNGMTFTAAGFIEELRRDENFAPLFRSATAPAPGETDLAPKLPAGERNPWNDADFNLTRQMWWQKNNPAVAARLKASAIKTGVRR